MPGPYSLATIMHHADRIEDTISYRIQYNYYLH